MPFPESPRVVFENNPLTQVIAQLRFPPILRIGAEDPAPFQDRIRGHYPLYRRGAAALELPPQIAGLVQQLNMGGALDNPSHVFGTEDGAWSVTLTREYIAIQTQRYQHWEEFGAKITEARMALEAIYQPAFYSRVGLRYVDVIDRQELGLEDEGWPALINEELIGLLAAAPILTEVTEIVSVASVSIANTRGGSVRLRHGLQPKQNGDAASPPVYVVDADFSTSERSAPNDVTTVFNNFNHTAGNLFRWAITPRLRDALRPRPMG